MSDPDASSARRIDPDQQYRDGLHAYSVQFGLPEEEVFDYLSGLIGPDLATDGIYGTGAAWGRGGLPWRERSIATVTALITVGGLENRLRSHFRWAITNGISEDELTELLRFLVAYIGLPKVTVAMEQLRLAVAEGTPGRPATS